MNHQTRDLTVLAVDGVVAADRSELLETIVRRATTEGEITDTENAVEALIDRERVAPTDIGDHVAIPHAETSAVGDTTVVVSRPATPVQFSDTGEPVSLVVVLLVPDGDTARRRPVVAAVARTLLDDDVRDLLREASGRDQLRRQFAGVVNRKLAAIRSDRGSANR